MTIEINGRKFRVLIPSSEISQKVVELGKKITEDYEGKEIVIICVLKGGLIFASDLIREIDVNTEIDFIRVSSYGNGMEAGEIELITDISTPLKDKHILLLEDLIDTGATLDYIIKEIVSKEPASIKNCTLVRKNKKNQIPIEIDYVGFEIEDNFIVGYGTDYAEQGRNLTDIYVIKD